MVGIVSSKMWPYMQSTRHSGARSQDPSPAVVCCGTGWPVCYTLKQSLNKPLLVFTLMPTLIPLSNNPCLVVSFNNEQLLTLTQFAAGLDYTTASLCP